MLISSNVIGLIQISFVRVDWCDKGTDIISSVSHFVITGVYRQNLAKSSPFVCQCINHNELR